MSVTDEAIGKIKQLILSGQLRPGDKLPREKEFGVQLGLSRSSLREAVRALTLLGILRSRRGDGTYVTSLEPEQLMDTLSYVVDLLQDESIVEVYEVRRLLESAATSLAVARLNKASLLRMRDCMGRMENTSDVEKLVEADIEFHNIIASASGNAILTSLIDGMASRTFRARRWRGITEEGALDRTHAEHRAIYQAIMDRDPELARMAAAVHIAEGESWIKHAQAAVRATGAG